MIEQSAQGNDVAGPPLRALVVDDQPDVAMSLALLLRHLGYTVQVAHGAEEALKKGAEFLPNVIFLDIGLPDLSGYDVCKEIRGSDWGLNSYIVAVTGRNEAEDMIRAANSGFDRHVGKPMEPGTLQKILLAMKTRSIFLR